MNPPETDPSHRVALMGFTSFEQQALESYLSLARSRSPAYGPAMSLDEAQFIVANGDRPGVIDQLVTAHRMRDTVLVGSHARQGSAAWLERPIDPLHLFRALDTAVKRQLVAPGGNRVTPRHVTHAELREVLSLNDPLNDASLGLRNMTAFTRAAVPASAAQTGAAAMTLSARAPSQATYRWVPANPHGQLSAVPKRVPPGPGEPLLALVVGADDAGALSMAMALQAHGISSERVLESRRAFLALQEQVFDLIVIDVDQGLHADLDGLSLAQAMKRQPRPYGDPCAPIFLMSSQPSPLEHAQAMVAGADAYLAKPVAGDALMAALELTELRTLASATPLPRIA